MSCDFGVEVSARDVCVQFDPTGFDGVTFDTAVKVVEDPRAADSPPFTYSCSGDDSWLWTDPEGSDIVSESNILPEVGSSDVGSECRGSGSPLEDPPRQTSLYSVVHSQQATGGMGGTWGAANSGSGVPCSLFSGFIGPRDEMVDRIRLDNVEVPPTPFLSGPLRPPRAFSRDYVRCR